MDNGRDKEMCAIALDEAFKLCGNPESTFQQTAIIMGMNKADIEAVSPLEQNYSRIVSVKPSRDVRSEQRWVLARAWELATHENMGVIDAFNSAWAEIADMSIQQATEPVLSPGAGKPYEETTDFEDDTDGFPID
jgi:hypothetical protein